MDTEMSPLNVSSPDSRIPVTLQQFDKASAVGTDYDPHIGGCARECRRRGAQIQFPEHEIVLREVGPVPRGGVDREVLGDQRVGVRGDTRRPTCVSRRRAACATCSAWYVEATAAPRTRTAAMTATREARTARTVYSQRFGPYVVRLRDKKSHREGETRRRCGDVATHIDGLDQRDNDQGNRG